MPIFSFFFFNFFFFAVLILQYAEVSIYLVGRLYFIHRSDIISYWTIAAVVCIIESIRTPEIETEQDSEGV